MVSVKTELREWEERYEKLWEQYLGKKERLEKRCWKALERELKRAGFAWNDKLGVWERGSVRVDWGGNYIEVLSTDFEEGKYFADVLNDGTLTITGAGVGGMVHFDSGRVECVDVMRALWEALDMFGEGE